MRTRRRVAVFQHTEVGAPGAAVPILESLGCEVELIRIVNGDAVPADASRFAGLVFMGGYMGARDPLPWIAGELALIRDADRRGIPVAGHCLGSQIIALALGGDVRTLQRPEIGWCEITADASATAREWWGDHAGKVLPTFQWHADTFQPPECAVALATGVHCRNQAFVLKDIHLLIQSHLEMTPGLVHLAVERNGHQMLRQNALANPATSDYRDVLRDLPRRTQQMHVLLQRLYSRWLA